MVARFWYRNRSYPIGIKKLSGEKKATVSFALDISSLSLKAGKAKIELKAFDRSIWSNSSSIEEELVLDFLTPEVERISHYHNAYLGGAEPIIYRAKDKNLTDSGVLVEDKLFSGYALRSYNKKLRSPNTYLGFYIVNDQQKIDQISPLLFAEDIAKNMQKKSFSNRVSNRRRHQKTQKCNNECFEKIKLHLNSSNINQKTFDLELNKLRNKLNSILQSTSAEPRYWDVAFSAPKGVLKSNFGDSVNFFHSETEDAKLFSYQSQGLTMATNPDQEIATLAKGKVIFTGSLPVIGQSIIVNHGFGVSSLYGSLSSLSLIHI